MKTYNQFDITFHPFNVDLISGLLWELKISGIQEYDNYIQVYSEEDDVNSKVLKNFLDGLVKQNMIESFSLDESKVENKNWNEEWEKKFSPIEVTEKIVLKPSFKEYQARDNQIVITIDPKMSFGTGEHQTTKLMLQLVEKYLNPGDKVLDVGSGTGILAIAAAKLGASKITAVDNDEWCYDNGIENVQANDVGKMVDVRIGEISSVPENDFDLVIANLNKFILVDIVQQLVGKVKPGGLILLSGLLDQDEEDITGLYKEQGQNILEIIHLDEWIALALRN
jgi:ribosomal protein L11 methyltransferase